MITITGDRENWYVLYTKSRHEKFVESELLNQRIEAFTPKMILRKRWSDRFKYIEEPLFSSYCFAKFSLWNKEKVLSQAGVVNVVSFNKQYVSVQESVVKSLKILMKNKIKIDPCPYFKVGSAVEIKKGPLKGLVGYVEEKRNRNATLVVTVDAILSSVRCVVDVDCVDLA
ncbi:MAG: transcription termination/antitermination NusG family protein [Candidatus Omnitrophota bacterium]|nr:hypothetical protein [Candidatus Omnitrophota bacterium]